MITAVSDASQVAEARRLVSSYARSNGVAEARVAELAIVVTELATNLLKHAGGGHILATYRDDAEGAGLELLALDSGSGMTDVGRCMDDGYSTAGSPGNGLGAIARLADDVQDLFAPRFGQRDHGAVFSASRTRGASHVAGRRRRAIPGRTGVR